MTRFQRQTIADFESRYVIRRRELRAMHGTYSKRIDKRERI